MDDEELLHKVNEGSVAGIKPRFGCFLSLGLLRVSLRCHRLVIRHDRMSSTDAD